jgi:hypothetical protein
MEEKKAKKEKYEKPELITEVMALEVVRAQHCETGPDAYDTTNPVFNMIPAIDCTCDVVYTPLAY